VTFEWHEGDIMHNHGQNEKLKINIKNQDSLGITIIFLSIMPPSAFGQF
jgi:hypothetical protein